MFFSMAKEVQEQLYTDDNKNATVTISDLELLGILMHWLVL